MLGWLLAEEQRRFEEQSMKTILVKKSANKFQKTFYGTSEEAKADELLAKIIGENKGMKTGNSVPHPNVPELVDFAFPTSVEKGAGKAEASEAAANKALALVFIEGATDLQKATSRKALEAQLDERMAPYGYEPKTEEEAEDEDSDNVAL